MTTDTLAPRDGSRRLFTLACIHPALLNSDQLPSCGVDGENYKSVGDAMESTVVFPSFFRAKCLAALGMARSVSLGFVRRVSLVFRTWGAGGTLNTSFETIATLDLACRGADARDPSG